MKRIWHHYEKWEEYRAGMWRSVPTSEAKLFLEKAVAFTGDHFKYGKFMVRVTNEWPISCEHNLTDLSQNRQAWIGHAAACLAINCPEYITREAWGMLTEEQRVSANAEADRAILAWERRHEAKGDQLCFEMGAEGI